MKINNIYKIFIVLFFLLTSSCTPIVNALNPPTSTPTSTLTPTRTPTPTPTVTVTPIPTSISMPTHTMTQKPTVTVIPTKTPEVESGKIEEDLAKNSYVQMYNANEWFGGKHPDPRNVYYKMYESHEWTERGLQIKTPEEDIILIEYPTHIGNNLVSITFKKNGITTSNLIISEGTIIRYTTWFIGDSVEETTNKSYMWGTFDSRTGELVNCTRSGSCRFENAVTIGISENWIPRQDLGKNTQKRGSLLVPLWVIDDSFFREYGIELFTYRFEDGEIYRFGPLPLVGPYVQIIYP